MSNLIKCHKPNGEIVECKREDFTLRSSVYGLFFKDDSVLLVPQWDGYDFPGGGIDLGESIKEAFVREVKEETGYDSNIGKIIIAANDNFYHPEREKPFQTVLILYAGQITGGGPDEMKLDEHELNYAGKPVWIKISELQNEKFYSGFRFADIDIVQLIKSIYEG